MLNFFNRIISLTFYAIFLVVPLTFAGDTSELFEFNKMWLTYGLALVLFVAWTGKMILEKRIVIARTPLDIPLGLFLASLIISSIWFLDPYVSFWGYYSRFNGGLLSIITYVFLYYCLVSNASLKQVIRYLYASIIAGVLVALWGLPSHFGYDPTCLLFRGSLDVSCWTVAFQPKIRIFSTLGQPDWLSAYLVLLTPLAFAFGLQFAKAKKTAISILFTAITFLFYVDNLYTQAKSGFIGITVAMTLIIAWYLWSERSFLRPAKLSAFFKSHTLSVLTLVLIFLATFFINTSIPQIDRFTFAGLQHFLTSKSQTTPAPTPNSGSTTTPSAAPTTPPAPVGELGGSDSGKIRLFVWQGAIAIFKAHPIFGSGVETFAYAYYQYRPSGHNLTSEWDYLYNKAHNEYLNYLATTGAFGLGSYLLFIGMFLFIAIKRLSGLLVPALLAGFISILITNFFGFSVVSTNTYLFLIPIFVFFLLGLAPSDHVFSFPYSSTHDTHKTSPTSLGWLGITIITLVACYLIIVLIQYRNADVAYALGQNLDHVGQYQQGYPLLHQAVQARPDEPVFKDELSLNDAVLAAALATQNDSANAGKLAQEAIAASDDVTTNHPNNVVFWKTRVRVMYTLAQFNPQYLPNALLAIQKAQSLAPTDAKVSYNLGLMYGQMGSLDQAIATLKTTAFLKPDYSDAYFALGTFYRQKAVGKDGKKVIDIQSEQQAVDTMHYIITQLSTSDKVKPALDALKSWGEK